MSGKKVWTKEETLELICLYESHPEIWDSRHMLYKDRDKRSMCWQLMGEALNTSVAEVQRKMHNLRNQVSNYFPYCTARVVFFVWNGLLICTLHHVHEHAKCLAKHVSVW